MKNPMFIEVKENIIHSLRVLPLLTFVNKRLVIFFIVLCFQIWKNKNKRHKNVYFLFFESTLWIIRYIEYQAFSSVVLIGSPHPPNLEPGGNTIACGWGRLQRKPGTLSRIPLVILMLIRIRVLIHHLGDNSKKFDFYIKSSSHRMIILVCVIL
jgi:hypothetical protein